jgi:hypothetical protein
MGIEAGHSAVAKGEQARAVVAGALVELDAAGLSAVVRADDQKLAELPTHLPKLPDVAHTSEQIAADDSQLGAVDSKPQSPPITIRG